MADDPARLINIYLNGLQPWSETYLTNEYRGITPAEPGIDYAYPSRQVYVLRRWLRWMLSSVAMGRWIDASADLRVSADGLGLETRLYMDALEVGGDTQATGFSSWVDQYAAPTGQGVASFYGRSTGPDVGPGYWFVDTDHDKDDILFAADDLVQRMTFIGDTSGDDVGETSVESHFNRVEVSLYTQIG